MWTRITVIAACLSATTAWAQCPPRCAPWDYETPPRYRTPEFRPARPRPPQTYDRPYPVPERPRHYPFCWSDRYGRVC
jgi:hypothetical protein